MPDLGCKLRVTATPGGRGAGLLGPLAIDPEQGELYALTPAQIAPPGATLHTDDSLAMPLAAGSTLSNLHLTRGVQPAVNLLVATPLVRAPIDIGMYWMAGGGPAGSDFGAPLVVDLPATLVGETLFINSSGHFGKPGKLVATESRFGMAHPLTDEVILFNEALELRAIGEEPLVRPGEIGAVVATASGHWVGVVVAGGRGFAFVAPLQPVLAGFGLDLLAMDRILKHNAQHAAPEPVAREAPKLRNRHHRVSAESVRRVHAQLEDA